jgi:hypothetical protein
LFGVLRGLEIGFVKEKEKKKKKNKTTAAARPTYSLQPSAAQLLRRSPAAR